MTSNRVFPCYSLVYSDTVRNPYLEMILYSIRNRIRFADTNMSIDDFFEFDDNRKKAYFMESMKDSIIDNIKVSCRSNRKSDNLFTVSVTNGYEEILTCTFMRKSRCGAIEDILGEGESHSVKIKFDKNKRFDTAGMTKNGNWFLFIGNCSEKCTMAVLMSIIRSIVERDGFMRYYKIMKMKTSGIINMEGMKFKSTDDNDVSMNFFGVDKVLFSRTFAKEKLSFVKELEYDTYIDDLSEMYEFVNKFSGNKIV